VTRDWRSRVTTTNLFFRHLWYINSKYIMGVY
jgi:hypothetical protein